VLTLAVFGLLVGLIMLGLPIAVAMGLTAVLTFVALGQAEMLSVMAQRMYSSTTAFPLLAIPFFILAGTLMNAGGMTQRIFRFAQCLVGHIKGGLGHVNVLGSMIFSGMSGAAVADAMGLGTVEIAAMLRAGYDRRFSAAITAASSTIGPIIPPSVPFVIYGSITGTSVGRLFLGGFIPGILMGLAQMVTVYVVASRREYPREPRSTLRALSTSAVDGVAALAAPVIIIGGILGGIFTPTEASVAASIYALILGMAVYREIKISDLPRILWETIEHTIRVMFIISAAGFFGWLLLFLRIPDAVIQGLLSLSTSPWVILLIINVVLIVLGCFMEGIAIMLLTIPVFVPLITKVGIDPVHFGVVMTLNLMIGLLTPPVGMALYAVASISQVSLWDLARELVPYMVSILVVLILITYIPGLVTWIPDLVLGAAQ
jgi:tripartite ATP-independent transporter DctM subunit